MIINRATDQQKSSTLKFTMTPKIYIMAVLLILALVGAANPADSKGILNIGVAVFAASVLDLMVGLFQNRNRLFPDAGIITGLIIALVLGSNVSWYITLIATVIALLSKHIIKIKRKPFFNPAAFGLLAVFLLFSSDQSWWGAFTSLPSWFLFAILVIGFLVTDRVNKFPQVLAYLSVYFGLALITGFLGSTTAGDLLRNPLINSALFLAFFMLTDPPTSPSSTRDQIIFGVIAGGVTAGIYLEFGGLVFFLIGLLVANAYNVLRLLLTSK